jgi:hypothetical protein
MKEHDVRIKLSEEYDQEYHRKLEEVIAIEKRSVRVGRQIAKCWKNILFLQNPQ